MAHFRTLWSFGVLLVFLGVAGAQNGPQYLISTAAGGGSTVTPVAGTAAVIETRIGGLGLPTSVPGVAVDAAGNVYLVSGISVLKLDSAGILTRVAGGGTLGGFSGDGGLAVDAQLTFPNGLAVDSAGNLYIADTFDLRVRKVSTSGIITTVAGGGANYSGDGGPATSAALSSPYAVAVDASGNLYIADTGANRIRKVSPSGIITTVAGNGSGGYSGDGGPATSATLNNPYGLAVDAFGNLYISDSNNARIRKVSPSGIITTVAGNGTWGNSGDGGAAASATLASPLAIATDASGNVYITDSINYRIRKISTAGIITTVAGSGATPYSGDGGPATSAGLGGPTAVAVDASGNLFIADGTRIRRVSPSGTITTVAGGGAGGDGGPAVLAQLNSPRKVAVDSAGNLYIADWGHGRVRKVSPSGIITTVAGNGNPGYSGDGGPATSAQLSGPVSVAVDASGNLYIADAGNFRIRRVSPSGIITTVAGNGKYGFSGDGGPATSAGLTVPYDVAVDAAGNLYIADTNNALRIRQVSPSGIITTIAGIGVYYYSGDGGPATSAGLAPVSIAVDGSGNLYVADLSNERIRKISSSGIITTVAGNGAQGSAGDGGLATSAELNLPNSVAADASGNLYIADQSDRIRKIDTSGIITTIAGSGTRDHPGDGVLATSASLYQPTGIAVDAAGNIYVADAEANRVRVLTPLAAAPILSVQSAHTGSFTAGQTGATYTVTVTNGTTAAATNGTVRVTEFAPNGLTLVAMAGAGWNCSGNTCTRNDALSGGASFPPITVTVNVALDAPPQVTNQTGVSGGGGTTAGANDFTLITPQAPVAPVPLAPANGATGVTLAPTLSWRASSAATSYDVYLGTSAAPAFVATTVGMSYSPGPLSVGTAYYWKVTARNVSGTADSATWSFTTATSPIPDPPPANPSPTDAAPTTSLTPTLSWSASVGASSYDVYFGTSRNPSKVGSTSSTSYIPGALAGLTTYYWKVVATNSGGSASSATWSFTTGMPPLLISTMAGGGLPVTPLAGTAADIDSPYGVTVDAAGNVYLSSSNCVFKLDTAGTLTRVAGNGVAGYSGDGGSAIGAQLNNPGGIAADASGNLYIADVGNSRVRKVSASGIITTVGAGNGTQFGAVYSVAVDAAGNLYIASNALIRMVSASGTISTVAGNGTPGYSGDGGPATSAALIGGALTVDASGNLYVAGGHRIRKISTSGIISTVAGNGIPGYSGDGGPAINAQLWYPSGLAADASGNLYIAEPDGRIRMVSTSGIITTVAGNGNPGYYGDGGPAASAVLYNPSGVALDASGNLYIADSGNWRVRQISASGIITTIVGGGSGGDGGPAPFAQFRNPGGLALDGGGNLYIADTGHNRIRRVSTDGTITTVAGIGAMGASGDGGPANRAALSSPGSVAVDAAGNLYFSDSGRVRKVSASGIITTVAIVGGSPGGVAVDVSGNVYIANYGLHRIAKVSTSGVVTILAGNGTAGYSGDGGPAPSAQLNYPAGLAVDGAGNLYIADTNNNCIRKVSTAGIITTVAGNGVAGFSGDGGLATSASMWQPNSVAVDASGNLYIADFNNNRIRLLSPSGIITTIAGVWGIFYSGDGGPATNAVLGYLGGVVVDSSGRIYVAGNNSSRIRVLTPQATVPLLSIAASHSDSFTAGQNGAAYTLAVSNADLAGPTKGAVTVTEIVPNGMTLASMSGAGWSCAGNSCTRNDPLGAGASYPPITVTVNVNADAPPQATNQTTVSGGGAPMAGASDLTLIVAHLP